MHRRQIRARGSQSEIFFVLDGRKFQIFPFFSSRNDKPFTCNICGGKFSRYSSLWSHKKLHSGEKNYKCDQCSSSFAKAVYLKNHMRIHSGEVRLMDFKDFQVVPTCLVLSETISMQHMRHDVQPVAASEEPRADSHWVSLEML